MSLSDWLSELEVRRCPDEFIRWVAMRYHYKEQWPDPRSLPFGCALWLGGDCKASDGRPLGFVLFKKLQHHKQKDLFGFPGLPTEWQVLDLARVWVHPSLQVGQVRDSQGRLHSPCVFSRMVSKALKRVQRDWIDHHPPRFPELPYHITRIISYCELEHHDGVSYRAAGFERFGTTADGKKEIYLRRLNMPRWKYEPEQPPLFDLAQVLAEATR